VIFSYIFIAHAQKRYLAASDKNSKTNSTECPIVTHVEVQMVHDECWKFIYFRVKWSKVLHQILREGS